MTDARYVRDYVIWVRFADGVEGEVDLSGELHGEVFLPLKNKKLFRAVIVNPDWHTVSWPNGADLAPEFLYGLLTGTEGRRAREPGSRGRSATRRARRSRRDLRFVSNDFRIFAHGVTFDPDAYLASTPLSFDGVWRKGERGFDHPKSNGIFKMLGDGRITPTSEQEEIARSFLVANRDPGVTTFILGLQSHWDLEENVVGFCLGPPEQLMRLALEIGIAPTYYVTLNRVNRLA